MWSIADTRVVGHSVVDRSVVDRSVVDRSVVDHSVVDSSVVVCGTQQLCVDTIKRYTPMMDLD